MNLTAATETAWTMTRRKGDERRPQIPVTKPDKAPNSKLQAPEKHQAASPRGAPPDTRLALCSLAVWNLELLWSLELGPWCFGPRKREYWCWAKPPPFRRNRSHRLGRNTLSRPSLDPERKNRGGRRNHPSQQRSNDRSQRPASLPVYHCHGSFARPNRKRRGPSDPRQHRGWRFYARGRILDRI